MSSSSTSSRHSSSEEMEEEEEEKQPRSHVGSLALGAEDSEGCSEEDLPGSLEEEEEEESEEESEECESEEEGGRKSRGGSAKNKGKQRKKKKKKPGIIYLSSIPTGFNVSRTTAYFSKLGQVGRVFLQPNLRDKNKYRSFTEGWIEFTSKSVAREVAESLNCSHVGGKKRNKASELLWNVKYLPRFKWSHLTERANYEKAVHAQRMRSEVSQAKKEGDYFKANLDRAKRMKKSAQSDGEERPYDFFLKETDAAVLSRRKRTCTTSAAATPSSGPSKRAKREALAPASASPLATAKKGKKNKGKGKSSSSGALKRSEFLKNVFSGPSE